MTFPAQILPDGSPSPAAVFTNALLTSALYHRDQQPFLQFAAMTGSQLVAFDSDPATFRPDYGVLLGDGEAMVVLDGTTNFAQWVGHCESALFPLIDNETGNTAVGSFLAGLFEVETIIRNAIRPATNGRLVVTGHSYGAGAGKLFCDHMRVSIQPPSSIELMTFGEPKSSGDFRVLPRPMQHVRIIARLTDRAGRVEASGIDPVTFSPPGVLMCARWPLVIALPLTLLGIKYKYFGQAWALDNDGLHRLNFYDTFPIGFDPIGWIPFVNNLGWYRLHLMDESYLTKAIRLWRNQPASR